MELKIVQSLVIAKQALVNGQWFFLFDSASVFGILRSLSSPKSPSLFLHFGEASGYLPVRFALWNR